ncbi:diacylglycerol/lipid kinase family protein [Demequina globuliformis]|uniref:diacylglycerol/lipid kinase family protein n=1 Tax=Demequina globuliformis TaxID=676202 RepID=UPI000783529D|nr:diacylglycerol kinase family protein [Demequina globuliformis]
MIWPITLGVSALVIAVIALTLAITVVRRIGSRDPLSVPPFWRRMLRIKPISAATAEHTGALAGRERQLIAFVANPSKNGVAELRERAMRACSERYLPEPLWLHTTVEDPGTGQAAAAIAQGADVVVAIGGDGTVRAVADALAGTDVAMGIIPMGTGNLFARNLDLPLTDTTALLRTVLEGADQRVDVGYMDVERAFPGHGEDGRHLFLVMAGAGMDAEMVASADATLKKRVGWLAYFFAAIEHLGDKRMKVTVAVDDGPSTTTEMRTVLLANAGRLPGGLQLIPDASITDGELDIATLDARGGLVGWTELFGSVVAQGAGIKQSEVLRAWRTSRIDHARAKSVSIEMESPQRVQVDGESLGRAIRLRGHIEPAALTVRIPVD